MKSVAIMTWYSYRNYGSALQAFAIHRTIQKMGYLPSMVAYDPLPVQQARSATIHRTIFQRAIGKIEWLLEPRPLESKECDAAFDRFICSGLNLTEAVAGDSLAELSDRFDAFVCGSDQIWSPRCFDAHYYLDFVDDSAKKIAYAPSFGCEGIQDGEMTLRIAGLLREFGSIAVREKSGADIVEGLVGMRPQVVLDPTLLLDAEEWRGVLMSYAVGAEPYCLFYFLGSYSGNLRAARRIARSRGLRVLEIPVFREQEGGPGVLGSDVGPAEFVSLVAGASLVCTDSFHGMVFSTLFNRPFVPFERFDPRSSDSQNTRVYNFLKMVGLNGILLTRAKLRSWRDCANPVIDFSSVAERISLRRRESLQYLESALLKAMISR